MNESTVKADTTAHPYKPRLNQPRFEGTDLRNRIIMKKATTREDLKVIARDILHVSPRFQRLIAKDE